MTEDYRETLRNGCGQRIYQESCTMTRRSTGVRRNVDSVWGSYVVRGREDGEIGAGVGRRATRSRGWRTSWMKTEDWGWRWGGEDRWSIREFQAGWGCGGGGRNSDK